MVRVGADGPGDPLLFPMEMRGRQIRGWLTNGPAVPLADADLARIVALGVAYVRTLPPKG